MLKKSKPKKTRGTPVTLKYGEETRVIGHYIEDKKLFECTRSKEAHFMRKNQSWGLDRKVVDFLVVQDASVVLTDKDSKWKYKTNAKNFKTFGTLSEYGQHGEQYFLPVEKWEILRAKDRSYIVKCNNKLCRHNFASNCVLGGVIISDDGGCINYECK